jgi:hypothetical protein
MQQRYLLRSIHHPSMRNAFVFKDIPSNETVSPLVYQLIENIERVVSAGATVGANSARLEEADKLRQEVFARDVRIEEMIKLIADLRGRVNAK